MDEIHTQTVDRWGAKQAELYVSRIWETFERIVADPERWRLRNDVHPGCRICFSGRHAVLYRVRNGRIEIARVLHSAMDFQRHIPPNFIQE